jgi:hypothetical protein
MNATSLQAEEYAYPNGGQTRKGRAYFPDGQIRRVWAGIPDTYFSIPAHARIKGRYVRGSLSVGSQFSDHEGEFEFVIYRQRCASRYPGAVTLNGRAIRCELGADHDGQHGHSFAARYWD